MNSTMRSPENSRSGRFHHRSVCAPGVGQEFHKDYPEVTLELVEDVTDGITRRVEAGELDVALASTCL